ncbi:hypothetical protein [Sorangium sp. So ce131]|uniref:hypothetical protein n=1 Tax=Sorangium sp. So ce131 TaxID=3133282 RepID=UPI003F5F3570
MKTGIFLRSFNLAVCGLAVAAFVACGDDGDGGGGSGGTGSGTGTTGTGTDTGSGTGTGTGAGTGTGTTGATTSATTGGGEELPTISDLIDDMEDGDNAIRVVTGREGYWYSFNDETPDATQTPAAGEDADPFAMTALTPAREQSTKAACTKGSGFATWGAGIGFDLLSTDGVKAAYDGSAHQGITFWAKIAAGTEDSVKVMISDKSTTPEGGHCDPDAAEMGCNDNWARTITLTEQWQQFAIAFEDLKVGGWGLPPLTENIDATALYSIQFQVAQAVDFDFCIDDLGFYQ